MKYNYLLKGSSVYSIGLCLASCTQYANKSQMLGEDFCSTKGFSQRSLNDDDIQQMLKSNVYSDDSVVPASRLKMLNIKYLDSDEKEQQGQMVALDVLADDVLEIFKELFEKKYPIAKMQLMDVYNGEDEKSMEDNNSSCYNFRKIQNSTRLSLHAYGAAIDINPLYNPFISVSSESEGSISPKKGLAYFNRTSQSIEPEEKKYFAENVTNIFRKHGFTIWGGDWNFPIDYQHFQISRPLVEIILLPNISLDNGKKISGIFKEIFNANPNIINNKVGSEDLITDFMKNFIKGDESFNPVNFFENKEDEAMTLLLKCKQFYVVDKNFNIQNLIQKESKEEIGSFLELTTASCSYYQVVNVSHYTSQGIITLSKIVFPKNYYVAVSNIFQELFKLKFPVFEIRHTYIIDCTGIGNNNLFRNMESSSFIMCTINGKLELAFLLNPKENFFAEYDSKKGVIKCSLNSAKKYLNRYEDRMGKAPRPGIVTNAIVELCNQNGFSFWGGNYNYKNLDGTESIGYGAFSTSEDLLFRILKK